MLHVYMCCYDCNLAIFIKLVSGIEPDLLEDILLFQGVILMIKHFT